MIILQAESGHVVHINDNVNIDCDYLRWDQYYPGSNQPNTVYNMNSVSKAYIDRFSISLINNASRLTITGAQFNDSGRYSCHGPTGSQQFQVTVVGKKIDESVN